MKKVRSISAEQIALAMKVIALHGKKQKVAIYPSDELLSMQMPIGEKEAEPFADKEVTFNWSKLEDETPPPIDEKVIFDRSKIKEVDREQ